MRYVLQTGGSVSSHSCNHFENWGGEPQTAFQEAVDSKQWLEVHVTEGQPVHYAVSPFYQNPPFAVKALAEAGYLGFIGGIICNDPEYLIGRAGVVPFSDSMIVSHSGQCMLHGDCYHRYGNTITPYIESFKAHMTAGSIFGYLDHPFSERYAYGWLNEEERLSAHTELIVTMKKYGRIWFPNVDQCLDFVRKKSAIAFYLNDDGRLTVSDLQANDRSLPDLAVSCRGEIALLESNGAPLDQ